MYNQKVDRERPEVSFDWDDDNISHLARHRIEPADVEDLFCNDPTIRGQTSVGRTNSLRVLVVVFTVRRAKIRPITGWEADRRTKRAYFMARGT